MSAFRLNAGKGRVVFRGMFSAEPWTVGGCGYPDLLASGEQCRGRKIHDRQHPHDLVMEMSAAYDAPLTGSVQDQQPSIIPLRARRSSGCFAAADLGVLTSVVSVANTDS